jgi:hypothetical protein
MASCAPSTRIQAGGQLIEDHHLGVAYQRESDGQPLTLSAGELAELRPLLLGEAEVVHQRASLTFVDR